MILVRIFAIVSENQVRRECPFQVFEDFLHVGANKLHASIRKGRKQWASQTPGPSEKFRSAFCLGVTDFTTTKHDPMKGSGRVFLSQTQDGTAATYL
jgi:hypothetical protein